ncbi:MAG: S9 family peptidase, partial [Candidatus Aminicenantes bacterium]|nr:S9 family peptidase [Candidatus Aminicenantes bacterium]
MNKKVFSIILIVFFFAVFSSYGEENIPVTKANYELPARFTPNKMKKMVFSTFVDAHWLKHSNRLWYIYETSDGKVFTIIDPAKQQKRPIFDNVKMAAMLTEMTKDPYEAKHLPMNTIKFIKNDTAIYFKVEKNKDVLEAEKREEKRIEKEEKKDLEKKEDIKKKETEKGDKEE